MKPISLEPVFIPQTAYDAALHSRVRRLRLPSAIVGVLEDTAFDKAYDLMRAHVAELAGRGEASQAMELLEGMAACIDPETEDKAAVDLHAALMQLMTALNIENGDMDAAAITAAAALNILARSPRRKDSPFLQVLASLLYDVAYLHSLRGEYKQAEREIEKSIKILERLAKTDPDRYAAPHLMALNGATAVYRNRVKQAELLAHYQAATTTYVQMLSAGVGDAAGRLVDSLGDQGDTLARMGRHREAVQYYSRALKYLTRIEPDFTARQLRLSVALGESMLSVAAMRDKGVHLLNTMLHKAVKINAADEHRRIVDILYHAKSRSLDILSLWHKLFPK